MHPSDQQKFIRCINGQVTVESCPHQQLFNPQHGFCQPYEPTAPTNINNNFNSVNDNQPIYNRGYNPPSTYNNIPPTVPTYNSNSLQRNTTTSSKFPILKLFSQEKFSNFSVIFKANLRGSNKGYSGISNRGYSRSYNAYSENNLHGSNNITSNFTRSFFLFSMIIAFFPFFWTLQQILFVLLVWRVIIGIQVIAINI